MASIVLPCVQGQTRARRVCWLNVLSSAEGRAGVGVGSPAGQGQMRTSRICRLIGWNSCLGEGGDRYSRCSIRGLGGWLGVASDFVGAVALRGKRTRCVWWLVG